jgi:UPF0271 protein
MNTPKRTIDLNADLAEGCPWDEALLERVTSASLACGAHAGDTETIQQTLQAAKEHGVVIGAHPGYADREHFGRRELGLSFEEIVELVAGQIHVLQRLAAAEGLRVQFVKPHGALYNQAQHDPNVAAAVIAAVLPLRLPLLGLPGSPLAEQAEIVGVPYIAEGFADRGYRPDGQLIARGEPGALLEDPEQIGAQVIRLCEGGTVKTLCLHGDNPKAVPLADLVRGVLAREGIAARSFI